MTDRKKQFFFWFIAFLITLFVAVFQRLTGPSHPLKGKETHGEQTIAYKLPRSAESGREMSISIHAERISTATLHYRRLNSSDEWTHLPMTETQTNQFHATIPSQPPAGKVEYRISVSGINTNTVLNQNKPIVARFRGSVPGFLLALHILFMFASLLFAARCAFSRWDSDKFSRVMAWTTATLLFIGGMILGPIIQKYAFGHFWTGIPFGTDLTDNKTLFIFTIWLITLFVYKKRTYILSVAAILTLLIYLIPHSLMGSELDHQTGRHKNVYSTTGTPYPVLPLSS